VLGGLSRVGYTADPQRIANMEAIRARARAIADRSASDRVTFADVWTAELGGSDFTDGLHYSDAGAAKVAAVWFPVVRAAVDRVSNS
jgi:hypothetical protein